MKRLALPLVCLLAQAQDPWAPFTAGRGGLERYLLLNTGPDLGFAWCGTGALGAVYGRELELENLEPERTADLIRRLGGEGWALFSPSGQRLGEGKGRPDPAAIQDLMTRDGWQPLRERLWAHLRTHGEDGHAWLEMAVDLSRHAAEARAAGLLQGPLRDSLRGQVSTALGALGRIPGAAASVGARPSAFLVVFLALHSSGLDQDPEIQDAVARIALDLPDLIAADPEVARLWYALGASRQAELRPESTEEAKALALSLEGVPGRPWPPAFFAFWMRDWFRKDPADLAQRGREYLDQNLGTPMVQRLGRSHVGRMLETWGGLHVEGLLLQGHVEEALRQIGWLRARAGQDWPRIAETLRGNLVPTKEDLGKAFDPMPLPGLGPEDRARIQAALAEAPLPDPPLPRPAPLRVALLGGAPDLAWARLQISPDLEAWDPADLVWTPLQAAEARALRSGHAWPEGPRWVMLRGEELLDTGPGLPTAQQLDQALHAQATPPLETVGAFIKAHPERLDARRERLGLLRSRMPNPRLEKTYLEDCEACGTPDALPFRPDPALWRPAAQRACARLAERLTHWPHDEAWLAYASWSALDSRSPRPAELLAGLEPWGWKAGIRHPGPLPSGIALGVMKALVAAGRMEEADAWARTLLAKGLGAWLALRASGPRDREGGPAFNPWTLDMTALLEAWRVSLKASPARAAAASLALESYRPGLGELLSGPAPRR